MDAAAVANKYIFTVDELKDILEREGKVIIYGAGDYGKRIADYIIFEDKQSKIAKFWITGKPSEHMYRGIKIIGSEEGYLDEERNHLIIIAVSLKYLSEISELVERYGRRFRCVTPDLYKEIRWKLERNLPLGQYVPYKGLDFLMAGFVKCGTTSLYRALREVEDIYLSEKKESQFFNWCDNVENAKEMLIESFFNRIEIGQIVGMIEPTFSMRAQKIRELFGSKVKILFLVRNPVDAVFSEFKMCSRDANAGNLKEVYQKFGGICGLEVFEEWFNQNKKQLLVEIYKYEKWINEYLIYYPKKQVKIVFFEEMLRNPRKIINDILQFVGSSCQYTCEDLPWANEGNFVMADVDGLEIAEKYSILQAEHKYYPVRISSRSHDEIFNMLVKAEEQFDKAKKICDLKLSEEIRKKLELYYYDSVMELEKMLNRNILELWFQ